MNGPRERIAGLVRHSGVRRYFVNTSWMMAEQVLRLVAGLFVGVYIARYLGPTQFGIYSYALAFVALFGAFAKLGLDGIVVRELVKHPNQREELLGTAFWLKMAGGIGTVAIIAAVLPWTSNSDTTIFYVLIVAGGLLFQAPEVIDFHFQSVVQAKYSSICKTGQLALSTILKIWLIWTGAGLLWFVVIVLVDQVTLAGAYFFVAWRKQLMRGGPHFVWSKAKMLVHNSWPLVLSGLAIMLYMRIDQVMIKEMLGDEALGIYSAAAKLSEAWYFIPVMICASVYPAIAGARTVSERLYLDRLRRLYSLMILLSVGVALLTLLVSDSVVQVLYGSAFVGASSVLKIHVWAGVFVAIGVANAKWFLIEDKVRIQTVNTALGAVLNILLNLVLLPRFGVNGAAMATLIAYGVASYLLLLAHRKTRKSFVLITSSLIRRS